MDQGRRRLAGASQPQRRSNRRAFITAEQRSWWAFQPVRKPEPPAVKDQGWAKTAIDHFVLATLEEKNLRPVQPADRRTLIRRATYDLTGLPPTSEEVKAFVNDRSPDAFEKVVDRLLASPRYGERWGRYWLDIARYSDDKLNSTQDEPHPNVWRYRDWVIRALNDDMPYDKFLKAVFSLDISPWIPNNGVDLVPGFTLSDFTFISTSGGGTDAEQHAHSRGQHDDLGRRADR